MTRTMNSKRNVRMVEARGAAALVECVGSWTCKLVWAAAVAGVLVLVARVVMAG